MVFILGQPHVPPAAQENGLRKRLAHAGGIHPVFPELGHQAHQLPALPIFQALKLAGFGRAHQLWPPSSIIWAYSSCVEPVMIAATCWKE